MTTNKCIYQDAVSREHTYQPSAANRHQVEDTSCTRTYRSMRNRHGYPLCFKLERNPTVLDL